MMEMAKVTSKGQITIPISIRRRLGINEGDKILFVNKQDGVMMLNPDTVQGDLTDYTTDSVPLDAPVTAPPTAVAGAAASTFTPAAALINADVPSAPVTAPVATPVTATPFTPEEPGAPLVATVPTPEPLEPPKRKYIPPAPLPEEKPAAAGGIDLSTLLDDIRSIGSNI